MRTSAAPPLRDSDRQRRRSASSTSSSRPPTASAKPKPAAKAPAKTAAAAAAPAKPALAASAGRPASGNWRIQLGAFSQRGNAETLYRKLSGKDALSGRSPFYVSSGSVTRLQIGPFESKSAAQAACNALGVACFPVPAK
jgi:cell division septation protein DedD